MTSHEMVEIAEKARKLREAGKIDESQEVLKQFPVAPAVARVVKEKMGVDFLRSMGLNLSRAEEKYGKDWLSR